MSVALEDVDLFDPEFHGSGNPHAVWSVMRRNAPLHRQVLPDGRAFWSVTRYSDACLVLGDHRLFTSERGTVITQLGQDDIASGILMTSSDPPRHTEVRRAISGRLTARAVSQWEHHIRHGVQFLLDGVDQASQPWDLAERAYLLPMIVAGAVLGVPDSNWTDLVKWTAMAAAPADPTFCVGTQTATLAICHHHIFEYFGRQIRERRENGLTDDLISHLMTMDAGGRELTDSEVVYNCYSLLLGANATTPHTVAGTVLALLAQPEQLHAVRQDSALLPSLVEEGLRWTSAASNFMRYAVTATDLCGARVEAGDAIVVWIGAANRDELIFDDPQRFDVSRKDNRHIAFGYGPHYCSGAALARLTLRIFFEEFLATFGSVELAGEPTRLRSIFISGMTHMPIATSRR